MRYRPHVNETKRCVYGVLNKQLIGQKFVAGEYSIADMAILTLDFVL